MLSNDNLSLMGNEMDELFLHTSQRNQREIGLFESMNLKKKMFFLLWLKPTYESDCINCG